MCIFMRKVMVDLWGRLWIQRCRDPWVAMHVFWVSLGGILFFWVAHLRLLEPLLCPWSSLGDLFWGSLECFANLFVPMVACRSSGEPLVDPWALWGGWESPGVGRCVPRTCFVDDFCFSWGWRGPGPKPKPFKF